MISLMAMTPVIKGCQRCSLRAGCNQVVTGSGPFSAKIIIIGEAPGADEDILGEPFQGRCGKLLDKILAGAGINRKSVYITNVVKCRPPGNATPKPEFINSCKPWLWEELRQIEAKVVLTLGKVPTGLLLKLKPSFKMKDVIGIVHDVPYIKSKVMSWYHPSYLLRRGLSWDQDTIDFFVKVKEQASENSNSKSEEVSTVSNLERRV